MIVIQHYAIYGDIKWIDGLAMQIKEAVGSAYTEDAFQTQLNIWQEQLEEIPYAKEHGVFIGPDKLAKNDDYTIYEPDEKGRFNIIGDILCVKVENINVSNGKGIVGYTKAATLALDTFATLSNIRVGNFKGYDPDNMRAQANAFLQKIYKEIEDPKGGLSLNMVSIFMAMMYLDHYINLLSNGLNKEAEEFVRIMTQQLSNKENGGKS